ncbi:MAG: zinc dependent phospholipase C family protein [Deltaproteobacteria bacterium]|nr:zinc dependent phospholipase C family protein [Deltaproteobacteria bacterium]
MSIRAIIATLTIILILPKEASAWGPATHLDLGSALIKDLALVSPVIAALIKKYASDFLYGNISADIVVAKNLTHELKHCHNWSFGFKLLERAESESQRAFAYGYLSHLASDTVAHNNFIPEMMVRAYNSPIRKHIYWEMRFDALAPKHVWRLPESIERHVHTGNDQLLKRTLEGTVLSFKTNKTIFSTIMNLQKINQWHHKLAVLSPRSRWVLHKKDRTRFRDETLGRITDLLKNGQKAACVSFDPIGRKNLTRAKAIRRQLKGIKKKNKEHIEEVLSSALKEFSFD